MKILVNLSSESLSLNKEKIELLSDWIHTNDKDLVPKMKAAFPMFITKMKQTAYRGMKLPAKSFETLKRTAVFGDSSFSIDREVAEEFAKIKINGSKSMQDFGVLYKVDVEAGAFDIDSLIDHLNSLSKNKDPSVSKIFDWRDEPWVWKEKEIIGKGKGKLEAIYATKKIAKYLDSSIKIVPKTVLEKGQFISADLLKDV
jgi:hypothetical protein